MWRSYISAEILSEGGNHQVRVTLTPGHQGCIAKEGLLNAEDLPEGFYEGGSMRRITDQTGDLKDVIEFSRHMFSVCLKLSDGRPIMWICSRQHARFYKILFQRLGWRFHILRGSERADNPYCALVRSAPTGGSADEHIVLLESIVAAPRRKRQSLYGLMSKEQVAQ
jgi:hypothetical protein